MSNLSLIQIFLVIIVGVFFFGDMSSLLKKLKVLTTKIWYKKKSLKKK